MKFRDLTKMVLQDGWYLKNIVGSHHQYIHDVKPGKVTINGHPSQDVDHRMLKSVLTQAGLKKKR